MGKWVTRRGSFLSIARCAFTLAGANRRAAVLCERAKMRGVAVVEDCSCVVCTTVFVVTGGDVWSVCNQYDFIAIA